MAESEGTSVCQALACLALHTSTVGLAQVGNFQLAERPS